MLAELPASDTSLSDRGFRVLISRCCRLRLLRPDDCGLLRECFGLVRVEFLFGEEEAAVDGTREAGSKAFGSGGGCTRCISVETEGGSDDEAAVSAENAGSEPCNSIAPAESIWFNIGELLATVGGLGRSGG